MLRGSSSDMEKPARANPEPVILIIACVLITNRALAPVEAAEAAVAVPDTSP
jgi:hypothetical protein